MKVFQVIGIGALVMVMTGCSTDSQKTQAANIDPYIGYNRFMFRFNMDLTKGLLEPAVNIYDTALPPTARKGAHNFFENAQMPVDIGNDILQGNFKWAMKDIARFFLNTIFGVGGLVDVASDAHLYPRTQGFGLTLAKWGWKDSSYLVLPVLGPSTVRGGFGLVPDFYMSPINYAPHNRYYWTFKGLQYAQIGSDVLPKMNFITQNALDPYIAMRNAYLQNRKHLIEEVSTESDAPGTEGHQSGSYVHQKSTPVKKKSDLGKQDRNSLSMEALA